MMQVRCALFLLAGFLLSQVGLFLLAGAGMILIFISAWQCSEKGVSHLLKAARTPSPTDFAP